jgi:hypothetical protein
MNKKLTLGIGVCALAFGAVAAVISTRAIEAKAEAAKAATVYLKAGVWKTEGGEDFYAYTWNGTNENQTWTKGSPVSGTTDVYSFTLPTEVAPDNLIFTRNDPSKEAGWDGKWNQTGDLLVPSSDDKTFYKITDWDNSGYWDWYVDVADGAYLAGDHNSWTIDANSKGTASATNLGEWEGVALTATQKFKIVLAKDKSTEWFGGTELLGDDPSKALVDVDTEGNLKPKAAGTYNFYFANDKKLYITQASVATKEYHLVGLGGVWTATDENKLVEASETGFAAKIEYVELKVGDTFKITETTGDKWYGYDSGILISEANLGKIVDDGTSNHNFKVAEGGAGTYSIYFADDGKIGFVGAGETVADLVAPTPLADGYYIVGLGKNWTKSGAKASDELTGGNKFQKTGIAMTHGDEFKIVGIKDDAIDWDDKIVAAPTKGEGETDQSANFVTVNDHNNGISLKAIASGTFDVYVNSSSEIYVFGTAEERTAAKEVDEFIDDFITPNVTNPDDKGKYETWESCNDKYTTAATVLERLSAQAKSMFLVDAGVSTKIETARAAYTWWQQHKDVGEGAKYIAPLSAKNTAIIAVASVVAVGGIIAASMIYFSRKKKQN